jgi:membrane protein YqaA with SNARE-associated domain
MAKSNSPYTAESRFAFPQAARACAMKVGIGIVATVVVLALLGVIIDHHQTLLWLVAIGGQFWGSIAVGTFAVVVAAWACCLADHLPEHGEQKAKRTLLALCMLAAILWFVSALAMHSIFDDFHALNTYEQIAVVVMHLPFIPACMCLAAGILNIADALR